MVASGMKGLFQLRIPALLAAGLLFASPRVGAQSFFGLSVTESSTSVLVSNSLTYTINLTNQTGGTLTTTFVTNQLPSSAQFQSASPAGSYTNNGGVTVFDVGSYFSGAFQSGQSVTLTLTVLPTAAGTITNMVIATSFAGTATNNASTNIVVLVTNALPLLADLGVAVAGPVQPVVTNDWMTYFVSATNAGPDAATSVTLTNTLPPDVKLLGATPANYTASGSNLIFNLGALAAGAATNFQFTIQPTNVGPLTLSASIGSGVLDTNLANNSAATNIIATNYPAGLLLAFTNSAQAVNPQNGLEEQTISLMNTGGVDVPAARVVVTGLTKQLVNAVGTNNGSPFVDYSAPLPAGQSVTLLLQYAPRGLFPFTNGQLQAFPAPMPNWAPLPATTTGTNVVFNRIVRLANGNMLLEWFAVTNRTYTVVYSDNILFSNAMIAPPSITIQAPVNEVQWIDYGPPTTASAPTNSSARFYRVYLNP